MVLLIQKEEKDVIIAAAANGRLKPERADKLISQVEKFQKDSNSNKILMYKNAVRVVMKEAGAPPDILNQLDTLRGVSGDTITDQINSIIGSNMDMTAYTAVNNLTRLIAEGEKKGVSMYNMLMNPNSPDYFN